MSRLAFQIVYSNSVLFNLQLTNESRSKHATVELKFRVDIRTPVQMLKILERGMKQAMEAKPMDFVKDSFSIYICEVQPGRWMDVSFHNSFMPVTPHKGSNGNVRHLASRTNDLYVISGTKAL